MIHLDIKDGKLKTSFQELKDELHQLLCYESSRLNIDDNYNINGYININNDDGFNESDILSIIAKHTIYFKIEAEEDDYTSPDLFSDFIWDGNKLIQLYKNSFGSIYEIEDWTWILND